MLIDSAADHAPGAASAVIVRRSKTMMAMSRPGLSGRECDRSADQAETDNADARKWRVRFRHVTEILLLP